MAIVPDESRTSAPEADFGANDWLLEEMYEQYLRDPASVDPEWRMLFENGGKGLEPVQMTGNVERGAGNAQATGCEGASLSAPAR